MMMADDRIDDRQASVPRATALLKSAIIYLACRHDDASQRVPAYASLYRCFIYTTHFYIYLKVQLYKPFVLVFYL
jgi:hypothetical protein